MDAYWPAAALPKLCSFDASKVLVAMVQGESRVGPLVYSRRLFLVVSTALEDPAAVSEQP